MGIRMENLLATEVGYTCYFHGFQRYSKLPSTFASSTRPQLCIVLAMKLKSSCASLILLLSTISIGVSAQTAVPSPCGLGPAAHGIGSDAVVLWHGIKSAPRNAIRPRNLAWELPIGAATGLLIAKGDLPAIDRIQSKSLQDLSSRWSNIGIGLELGAGALGWTGGCMSHNSHLSEAGFTALTAFGAASATNLVLKFGFGRQYPYTKNSTGDFWDGGGSFPSGHAATSFAFAAVVAHRYPHNPWIKWGAYALATGVSVARYPAKKHFPSDILIGGTIGYVTGTYIANHTEH